MKLPSPVKSAKRAFYRARLGKFKRIFLVMCAVGIICSLMYVGKVFYTEYASARAYVTLTYPEIASSTYPDGERFTVYTLIEDSKLQEALNRLQAEGKYENYTVEDIKGHLFLYSYLKQSAGQSVSQARSEGNDYTYVANEFRLTYIQPHDYRSDYIVERLLSPDYSVDFLEALVEVNREEIAQTTGGPDGYVTLTELGSLEGLDYREEVQHYRARVNAIINYLNELEKDSPGFVSPESGVAVKDLIGDFELLVTNKLDGILNYIQSSNISRDIEVTTNRLKVNLENNTLQHQKYLDQSAVAGYAIANYDHTFTENLINVVLDENNGLYQARPKTAFDTVVEQKHGADERTAEYSDEISTINQELASYSGVVQSSESYQYLCKRCEEYLVQLADEYQALVEKSVSVVEEYYDEVNEDYLRWEVAERELVNKDLAVEAGVTFVLGAMLAFIVCVIFDILQDKLMLRKKKRLLASIRRTEIGRI